MLEENASVDQNEKQEAPAVSRVDPFEEMERARKGESLQEDKPEEESAKDKPSKTKVTDESAKKNAPSSADTKKAENDGEDISEDETPPSEVDLLKRDVEKNKKSLLDAQKWGTKNSQKLKYTLKKINTLIENASFTEDEEREVLDLKRMLESDMDAPFEVKEATNENSHPIDKYVDIASEKLSVMKELADDPESFYKKYRAFEVGLLDYKPDEMKLLLDELDELKDNPVKLAKKIMDIGEQYYNDYYKEFEELGGFRSIIEKRNKEEKKLKNEIDKLKKKLLTYEDFDKNPRYHTGEDSEIETGEESSDSSNDPFERMEKSRNERLKQRR